MMEIYPSSDPEQSDRANGEPPITEEDRHLQRAVGDDTTEWLEELGKLMEGDGSAQAELPQASGHEPLDEGGDGQQQERY